MTQKNNLLLNELFLQSFLNKKKIIKGSTIVTTVLAINKDFVTTDVGQKSEGLIRTSDFISASGSLNVKVGDKVKVVVESQESNFRPIMLSYKKAYKIDAWNHALEMYKTGASIRGFITNTIKGGFLVDIGIPAFLPRSQLDIKPIKHPEKLLKKEFKFTIVNLNTKTQNIILSRRCLLESEFLAKQNTTLSRLRSGAIFHGKVKNIMDYGIFIDIGGIDGLLHLSDISWTKKIPNHKKLFQLNTPVTVKVLKLNKDRSKISLGIKQLYENPWINIQKKHIIGSSHFGIITRITLSKIFVSISPDLTGFIPTTEIAWAKPQKSLATLFKPRQKIKTIIQYIDLKKKQLHLGIEKKGLNPWSILDPYYKTGDVICGKISRILHNGLFVSVNTLIKGFIHSKDLFWTEHISPIDYFQIGENIEAVILNTNTTKERLSLGLKQLTQNPWVSHIPLNYSRGDILKGSISYISNSGIFAELESGIGGFCHKSQMIGKYKTTKKSIKKFKNIKLGTSIEAMISKIAIKNHKISLSIKAVANAKNPPQHELIIPIPTSKPTQNKRLGTFGDIFIQWKNNNENNTK